MSGPADMQRLDEWIEVVCGALGVDAALVDREAVLDLAGEAARGVVRPAAPVTTFVAGVVVGAALARGEDPVVAFAAAVDQVQDLLDS